MATFTNQATLTYNGQTTTSNVTVGELTETLAHLFYIQLTQGIYRRRQLFARQGRHLDLDMGQFFQFHASITPSCIRAVRAAAYFCFYYTRRAAA